MEKLLYFLATAGRDVAITAGERQSLAKKDIEVTIMTIYSIVHNNV